ncbi:MAG TPA: endonuclease/exonuclease/phosphatase family protein, partial [Polyangiaceae bacterium]
KVLAGLEPDIALLQEVAADMPSSRFHDQAPLLCEMLEMAHLAYGAEHRFRIGGYGNAILSRFPLSEIQRVDLTIGRRKKRGALKARADIRVGDSHRTLLLVNMHLGLAGSERDQQLQRFLASAPFSHVHHHTPIILGGDLNDLWGSLGPRYLVPAGFARSGKLLNTFPAALPLRPLDGIFVRGDLHVNGCALARGTLARRASDHAPLVADLVLPVPRRSA